MSSTDLLVEILRNVLGDSRQPLHRPLFSELDHQYVQDCISSSYVSSVGAYVERFEEQLASYTGARRAVATVNGTAALHIALQLSGVVANDEVIVPALTFVATANAVSYLGAVPHFADSNFSTLGLDPEALRDWLNVNAEPALDGYRNRFTGRRLSALVPMHTFGHPCDIEGLLKVARDFRLAIVEDAAESLGSFYEGQHTGTFGLCGILSFNGNKIITTGGGGAIITNDETLADRAKYLTRTAKRPHAWEYVHDEVGYNYRMPNLNAALGCAQLEKITNFLSSKRRLFIRYSEAFSKFKLVKIINEPPACSSNYWLNAILIDEKISALRDEILDETNNVGIETRPVWSLLSKLSPYASCPCAPLPVAETLTRQLINIPSSAGIF